MDYPGALRTLKDRNSFGVVMSEIVRGQSFVRTCIALAASGGRVDEAAAYASKRWGHTSSPAFILKSAVSGGSSANLDWSGLVDGEGAVTEFLEFVRPMSIIGKLEGLRRVPANTPYCATSTGATAYWTSEGKATPVSPLAFARDTMAPLKIACLVVLSRELIENSRPEAESLIRRDLARAITELSDRSFIDPTSSGTPGQMPASVTSGVTPSVSAGVLEDDLAQAVDAFGGDFESAAWCLHPRLAVQIALKAAGRGIGADLGPKGGLLLGLPAITSKSCQFDSTGGLITLLDAGGVVFLDEGAELKISTDADVAMDTEPSGDILAPAAETTAVVSLFTSDSVGLILTRRTNWALARENAVVCVSGCDYTAV
jgi:HK97 family phage major capsid protein